MAKHSYDFTKINLFLLIIISAFLYSCNDDKKTKDCENFKTGKFKYEDNQFEGWEVNRTENTQIERNDSLDITIESKVKWLSDCEFVLIYDNEKSSPAYAKMVDSLRVELTEIDGNSYKYRATGVNSDSEGTMILVD